MMIALVIVLSLINLILWSDIFYRQFFKRFYDIICALLALIVFCWLYALIAILVRIKLGSPVEIIDEGSFYRIDGTHIFDKRKIRGVSREGNRVKVEKTDKTMVLVVE